VEFAVTLPETLVVPAEAVLDSGVRKTVFVDRGEGYFEPRTIETGWRLGDYVQVLRGLMDAEPIVVSGNFLLDSESRMKLAAAGVHGMPEIDPVCGMAVDETKARAAGLILVHETKNWFFCNEGCKEEFTEHPARFLQPKGTVVAHLPMASVEAVDPVCNMKVDEAKARLGGRLTEHGRKTIYFCNPACKEKFDRDPAKYMPAAQSDPQARDGKALDPVCGMWVTEAKARAAGRHSNYQGKTYFFCNDACKEEFDANPKQFLKEGAGQ
jgi:YHS domain-containing protein